MLCFPKRSLWRGEEVEGEEEECAGSPEVDPEEEDRNLKTGDGKPKSVGGDIEPEVDMALEDALFVERRDEVGRGESAGAERESKERSTR